MNGRKLHMCPYIMVRSYRSHRNIRLPKKKVISITTRPVAHRMFKSGCSLRAYETFWAICHALANWHFPSSLHPSLVAGLSRGGFVTVNLNSCGKQRLVSTVPRDLPSLFQFSLMKSCVSGQLCSVAWGFLHLAKIISWRKHLARWPL